MLPASHFFPSASLPSVMKMLILLGGGIFLMIFIACLLCSIGMLSPVIDVLLIICITFIPHELCDNIISV